MGRNGETKCTKTEFISSVISARTRSTSRFERQIANTRFCRWPLGELGRLRTKNGTPRRSGIGDYAAAKLRKGDHVYVEGTLVSSVYEKVLGKGKSKITVPPKQWQVKADSIRKLNRTNKEQVPEKAPHDAQPEGVPF
jgi:hypothetical protein